MDLDESGGGGDLDNGVREGICMRVVGTIQGEGGKCVHSDRGGETVRLVSVTRTRVGESDSSR